MGPIFSPLAEALDLGASGYSPWIVESAVRLGSAGAFAPAASLLHHFTGVTMSPSTLRRLTHDAGTTMHQLELACGEASRAADPDPATDPDVPLQLSVDGSMIALVDEGWREVKLMAIGERVAGGTLAALTYAATLGTADAFGDEALGEVVRRGLPQAHDVVTVNDGADWIQGFIDLHCPQAHRILDFAHAAGSLAVAAQATYGEESGAAQDWFAAQRQTLRTGDPETVLEALQALPAGEARDRAWHYLSARRSQIAYRDFVARGWPIGSGCVESAHKGVVQARLKQRGMRWSRAGAEEMLALRIVQANARWDGPWAQVGAHQRAAQRARTTTRRAVRHPSPPKPKLVQDGKPTADHPWRRFRLPGSPRSPHTI